MMQYRLSTLFLLFVVLWSSLAVFGLGGIIVFALVCILASLLSQAKSILRALMYFAAIVLGLLFVTALFAVSHAGLTARRMQCLNNLKQIALGLYNYQQAFRCLPPACISDKNGKPMHSWRVLLLPYMEQQDLYGRYDFNEPWDGPNNKKLLGHRPSFYACASDEKAWSQGTTCTSYVAVVGLNSAWSGKVPKQHGNSELLGSAPNSVLVVEVADAGINWTEPRDLSLDELQGNGFAPVRMRVCSKHMNRNGFFYHDSLAGTHVALSDGSVRLLPAGNLRADKLKNLFSVGGCKDEDIVSSDSGEDLQVNWPNCFALAVWVASVALLLYRAVRSRKGAGELAVAAAGGAEAPMNTDKHASDQ